MTSQQTNVVLRSALFLKKRFAPFIPTLVVWFVAIDVLVQEAMGARDVHLSAATLFGTATAFCLIAVMRTTDEIKDIETDRAYFPDRPLVIGEISLAEVRMITWALIAIAVMLNLSWPLVLGEFALGLVFLFLMVVWYFAPGVVSKNRLLAITSNCPAFFFICLQQAQFTARASGLSGPAWVPAAVSGLTLLPLLSFEFARKTFLPADEMPGYQSYSVQLGLEGATGMAVLFAAAHLAGLYVLYINTPASSAWVVAGHALILLGYVIAAVRVVQRKQGSTYAFIQASNLYFVGGMLLSVVHGLA